MNGRSEEVIISNYMENKGKEEEEKREKILDERKKHRLIQRTLF